MNEPWAGDQYREPLMMAPYPSPGNADRVNLQPAYDVISEAVREVDEAAVLIRTD